MSKKKTVKKRVKKTISSLSRKDKGKPVKKCEFKAERIPTESASEASSTQRASQMADVRHGETQLVLNGGEENPRDMHEAVVASRGTLRVLEICETDVSILGDKLVDLFNVKHLSSITLRHVKLSHDQCKYLSNYFSVAVELGEVEIYDLFCTSHDTCPASLKLTKNRKLRSIDITELPFKTLVFDTNSLETCKMIKLTDSADVSVLECLRDARNLRELTLWHCSSGKHLAEVMPLLDGLHMLSLGYIDFGSVVDIRLSTRASQLQNVKLRDCGIPAKGVECLVASLPAHRVEVRLIRINIRGGNTHFLQKTRDSGKTDITNDTPGDDEEKISWFVFYNNI